MKKVQWVMAVALAAAGCSATDIDEVGDGEDDSFFDEGKGDAFGVSDGSPEACAVLKLAQLADFATLDDDAGLDRRAASHIVKFRNGADAAADTQDDGWFVGLADLDAVKWVGPKTFRRLLDYSGASAEYACARVDVQLLGFNDFHGNLKPPAGSSGRIQTGPDPAVNRVDAGGVEYMATHVQALAATNPNTVVVTAGDIIGATPLISALFHDEPTIESMNALGLAVAGVGNHEFDEGVEELWRMQYGGCHPVDGCADGDGFDGAAFSYLAANVSDEATGETVFPAYEIRRFGRARVAFVGMTLEGTPLVTTPAGTQGLRFADEADTVNALVPELRAQGVETIVVLLHEGGAVTGLYNECIGMSGPLFEVVSRFDAAIDVVVAGHTNAAHVCDVGGRLVTSAASFGRIVTDIDLVIDENGGNVVAQTARNVIATRDVARDAAQTALIARYDALTAPLANRVVGTVAGDLIKAQNPAGESTMGFAIADAQLAASSGQGAVAAFMNPGGVRADLLAATVSGGEAPGQATYGELFAVQPFGNTLMTITVTGEQLDTMLEQQWSIQGGVEKANILAVSQGFRYEWDSTRPIGSRVDPASISIGGVAVNPSGSYRITANSFVAAGGDGFSVLVQGTDRVGGAVDVDAFEAYFAAHSPFAPPALGRIVRLGP